MIEFRLSNFIQYYFRYISIFHLVGISGFRVMPLCIFNSVDIIVFHTGIRMLSWYRRCDPRFVIYFDISNKGLLQNAPYFVCSACELFRAVAGIQLVVAAFLGNELIMCAALNDASLFHDHDAVRVLYC